MNDNQLDIIWRKIFVFVVIIMPIVFMLVAVILIGLHADGFITLSQSTIEFSFFMIVLGGGIMLSITSPWSPLMNKEVSNDTN